MKQHAKVGNRAGKPAYRTPATFRGSQHLRTDAYKAKYLENKHNPNSSALPNQKRPPGSTITGRTTPRGTIPSK